MSQFLPGRWARSLMLACLVGMASWAAHAQPRHFDIPGQSLAVALKQFAIQSNLEILFAPQDVDAKQTAGVRGEYEPEDALRILLAGTGLRYRVTSADSIVVETATSASSGNDVTGDAAAGIEEILIRGRNETLSTLKGDAPLLEVPQNIQILSSALLTDMGATFLHDALRSVAGVMPGGAYSGYDYFRIRGFASDVIYLDGLRLDNFIINNAELYGLERVEVIKGPASTLYGDLFSGMVNLVSKRPKPQAFADLELTAGSFGFLQPALDFGGPIGDSGKVYGRAVLLYRHDGSFVDFVEGLERYYVAPSLTWEASERTRLTVFTNFQDDRNELAFSLPARGTVLPNPNGRIPDTLYYGDSRDPSSIGHREYSLGYQLTHEVNPWLSLRQNARTTRRKEDWDRIIYPLQMTDDERSIYRYPYSSKVDWKVHAIDTGADLRFGTGMVQHALTAGIDYFRSRGGSLDSTIDFGPDSYYAMPFDLFDPNYDDFAIPPLATSRSSYLNETIGLYVTDRARITDRLTLTFGGRGQRARGGNNYVPTRSKQAFVKNAGLNFEIMPGFMAYAAYSEAFLAQYYTRLAGGEPADPQRGTSLEAGLKMALLDDRVNATVAFYDLERRNVAAADPQNPGYSILTGKQRSRGFEYDSQILLAPGLQLVAAYAFLDGEILRSDYIPRGTPLVNAPDHSLSLWMKYTMQGGPLAGLGFSLGGSRYSKQSGDDLETFHLPAYTLVNANVSYARGDLLAQLNFNNLLDEEYFQGSSYDLAVLPGTPRSVRLTLGWSF